MRWVRDTWKVEPDEWQQKLLNAYATRFHGDPEAFIRYISVRSGHGVGKTTGLAWCILHHNFFAFPQKTVCTAPTSSQLFDALATETKSWLEKAPPAIRERFTVTSDRIELTGAPNDSFTSFRTSSAEKPEALAGVHSVNVLLIADEASGIPEKIFETAAGSMSGSRATTILAGNPTRTAGLFFLSHTKLRADWFTIHVNCETTPRADKKFIEYIAKTYGRDSNAYRVRVLGEFPTATSDTVIPFELAEAALKRDVKPLLTRPIWGVDVAYGGDDDSALCKRRGTTLMEPVKTWSFPDVMQVTGVIKIEWDSTPEKDRPEEILVDSIGYGAGVKDRLREMGLPARGINVAESPAMSVGQYTNLRAELWFKGREWFSARDCNICNDEALLAELVVQKYKPPTSAGKIAVHSKAEMKKLENMRSPNRADAFLLTLASTAATAIVGGKKISWAQPLRRAIKGLV